MTPIRVVVAASALLGACSWVLPDASQEVGLADSRTAVCTLDLAEQRRARSVSLGGLGAARPLVITLANASTADRAILGGSTVVLRHASVRDHGTASDADAATMTIESVDGRTDGEVWVHDGSVIRVLMRISPGVSPQPPLSGAGQVSPFAPRLEVRVYKADRPSASRPSTCDGTLRDGDYVFVQVTTPTAWVDVRDGRIGAPGTPSPTDERCRQPREDCYTDRYGELLCANYFTFRAAGSC
jgi:hypothetical protein